MMQDVWKRYARGLWNGRLILAYTLLVSLSFFIITPFLLILVKSLGKDWFGYRWLPPTATLDWFEWAFKIARVPEVMKNTLIIAALAIVMSTTIGICSGWAFGRRHLPGKEILMSVVAAAHDPAHHLCPGRGADFYALGLVDTHLGVALAHVSICAPYAILVLSSTFQSLDDRVLEAAGVCGASPVRTFFT